MKKKVLIGLFILFLIAVCVKAISNTKIVANKTSRTKIGRKSSSMQSPRMNVNKYAMMARSKMAKKDFQGALKDCEKAISENTRDINAYHCRADVYSKMGKKAEAFADYKKALEINPNDQVAKTKIRYLK